VNLHLPDVSKEDTIRKGGSATIQLKKVLEAKGDSTARERKKVQKVNRGVLETQGHKHGE